MIAPSLSRRGFIGGLAALIAAPAVVRAASLMPVRGIIIPTRNLITLEEYARACGRGLAIIEMFRQSSNLFDVLRFEERCA